MVRSKWGGWLIHAPHKLPPGLGSAQRGQQGASLVSKGVHAAQIRPSTVGAAHTAQSCGSSARKVVRANRASRCFESMLMGDEARMTKRWMMVSSLPGRVERAYQRDCAASRDARLECMPGLSSHGE